ncbi:hypothetical protein DOY81_003808 [Sarcophaga bullata]|nr:hypothetical protein DOY81_003808 [Sarcophaga bullata]
MHDIGSIRNHTKCKTLSPSKKTVKLQRNYQKQKKTNKNSKNIQKKIQKKIFKNEKIKEKKQNAAKFAFY